MAKHVELPEGMEQEIAYSADDELDLSGESSITAQRANFNITDVEVIEKENGTLAQLTLEAVDPDTLPYPVTATFWLKHNNPKAQTIGRGGLRRLFKAVLGTEKGALSALRGMVVSAWIKEDPDSGFARVGTFRKAEGGVVEAVEL